MTSARLADGLFWIVAALAVVCGVLFLLVLSGTVAIDPATEASPTEPAFQTTAPDATTAPGSSSKRKATRGAVTPARKPAQATTIVLTAARGDCWFQARAGSEQGRVLEERVLGRGESTRITSRRVWLAVGAAGNLDVTVNGKSRQLPAGTLSVVLDANA